MFKNTGISAGCRVLSESKEQYQREDDQAQFRHLPSNMSKFSVRRFRDISTANVIHRNLRSFLALSNLGCGDSSEKRRRQEEHFYSIDSTSYGKRKSSTRRRTLIRQLEISEKLRQFRYRIMLDADTRQKYSST